MPTINDRLTVTQILNMSESEFNKLNMKELRQASNVLVSAANKRIKRFNEAEMISPAYASATRSRAKFSTKGLNYGQLKHEFAKARDFLESKTGSVKAWKAVVKQTTQTLAEKGIEVKNRESFDKLWRSYQKLKESDPTMESKKMRYIILKQIAKTINTRPGMSVDSIVADLDKSLSQIYEKQEEARHADESGVSSLL